MIHFSKRSFALTGYSKIVATRFSDLDEGIIEVTRIANFKNWPIAEKKQDVAEFTNEAMETRCVYFKDIISLEDDTEEQVWVQTADNEGVQ